LYTHLVLNIATVPKKQRRSENKIKTNRKGGESTEEK